MDTHVPQKGPIGGLGDAEFAFAFRFKAHPPDALSLGIVAPI